MSDWWYVLYLSHALSRWKRICLYVSVQVTLLFFQLASCLLQSVCRDVVPVYDGLRCPLSVRGVLTEVLLSWLVLICCRRCCLRCMPDVRLRVWIVVLLQVSTWRHNCKKVSNPPDCQHRLPCISRRSVNPIRGYCLAQFL